jgi:diacylglycerol kinase family enzyme
MRVIAVINANAGPARGIAPEALGARIAGLFAERAVHASVALATGRDWVAACQGAVESAVRGEADAVVAGGGDGSVGAMAGLLAGTGVPMGVLPLGTLNHFARDLRIPTDLASAVALIAEGHTRAVDLAEVNGLPFVNNSSVGFYAILVLDRERRRSHDGLSKWPAMMLSGLRLMRRFSLRRLTVSAAGVRMHHRTPLVFVGNNAYRLHPPEFGTRDRLDTGKLWLCVASPQTLRQMLWLACRAFFGLRLGLHELELLTDETAEIASRVSRLPVALDGEVRILRTPLRYRARPGALQVFAPAPAGEGETR